VFHVFRPKTPTLWGLLPIANNVDLLATVRRDVYLYRNSARETAHSREAFSGSVPLLCAIDNRLSQ
jgi:hypothetical protein